METEDNENFLPEEYALNADKRELVLKIVQETCSDVLYQTILLHYFNEFSIAEIAEIMECPEGTVKYRLSAAWTKIKEGVLRYEKKSGDKLYSFAAIPFLTVMFTAQMQDMQMPSFPLSFSGALPQSTLAAPAAKAGGRIMLKSLQLKIAVGIAAAIVAVGGVTAAVIIVNQNAEEVSVGGQEENGADIADAGNTGDIETLRETENSEIVSGEESLLAESETAEEVETQESTRTEPTLEQTVEPEPEPQYTYIDMSATMYAQQSVNVRTLPSTDGEKIGALSTNQEIAITGQCNETGWYRFEYDGSTAYVSNNYVSENKVEVATQSASSGGSSSGYSLEGYPVGEWVDMGDWFYYINNSTDRPAPTTSSFWGDIKAILQERYPDRELHSGAGVTIVSQNQSIWFVSATPLSDQSYKNLLDRVYAYAVATQ